MTQTRFEKKRFNNILDIQRNVRRLFELHPKRRLLAKSFQNMYSRSQRCIVMEGDYFEGQHLDYRRLNRKYRVLTHPTSFRAVFTEIFFPPSFVFQAIVITSVDGCRKADELGADRLAVCQALDLGGLTRALLFVGMVKQKFSIPVYMFIRPKSGICMYTDDEIHLMKTDIEWLHLKVDGFVFGALKTDKRIDRIACREIVDAACGKPVTFHRAFDFAEDDEAYIKIIDLGFKRILTSGCRGTAYEGILSLKDLVDLAGSQITIMPGRLEDDGPIGASNHIMGLTNKNNNISCDNLAGMMCSLCPNPLDEHSGK
ncbi:copper homeostasis protein cutC homolog [Trichonephila clavipes]|nr:copper homeostasis protein cutC homolog [Trichonephila clavipes]